MPEAVNAEEIRIKALLENWADAVRRHDLPAILAHHERDMVMFTCRHPCNARASRPTRRPGTYSSAITRPERRLTSRNSP